MRASSVKRPRLVSRYRTSVDTRSARPPVGVTMGGSDDGPGTLGSVIELPLLPVPAPSGPAGDWQAACDADPGHDEEHEHRDREKQPEGGFAPATKLPRP